MDFLDTARRQLSTRAYWDFKGRAARPEFWLFMLFALASTALIGIASAIFEPLSLIEDLWSLFLAVPCLAVTARRLHDAGRSILVLVLWIACAAAAWLFLSRSLILAIYNPGAGMWRLLDDPNFAAGLGFLASSLVLLALMVVLLALPSRPGRNKYGSPDGNDAL
ncbi:MAG: DUF805 domain-containing protein [Succinivibrio sp.]